MDSMQILSRLRGDTNFSLTGSRYWNQMAPTIIKINEHTDWDFFASNDEVVRQKLVDMGFNSYKSGYMDSSAREIFSFNDGHNAIQVVLRDDVVTYRQMIFTITPEYYRLNLWKSGPNEPSQNEIRARIDSLLEAVKQKPEHILTESLPRTSNPAVDAWHALSSPSSIEVTLPVVLLTVRIKDISHQLTIEECAQLRNQLNRALTPPPPWAGAPSYPHGAR